MRRSPSASSLREHKRELMIPTLTSKPRYILSAVFQEYGNQDRASPTFGRYQTWSTVGEILPAYLEESKRAILVKKNISEGNENGVCLEVCIFRAAVRPQSYAIPTVSRQVNSGHLRGARPKQMTNFGHASQQYQGISRSISVHSRVESQDLQKCAHDLLS